jgi:hypothetical protein
MAKNREDFTDLCASIVDIITLLQEEISRHGADTESMLTQFCEQLKRCVSQSIIGEFHARCWQFTSRN